MDIDGNDEEKRCMLAKNDEKLGHGFFEDKELVNVVQNLVNSRYFESSFVFFCQLQFDCSINPLASHYNIIWL